MKPFRHFPLLLAGLQVALGVHAVGDSAAAAADGEVVAIPPGLEDNLVDPSRVSRHPSFAQGETLRFKLGWSVFRVARATLVTEPGLYEGLSSLKITLNTRTNAFADALYKVRNESTSWISGDVSRSFEYSAIQHEGGRERDTRVLFDKTGRQARYINHVSGEEREPVDILTGTFDPLGIVFLIRSIDFDVGDELVVPTSNGKEFFFTVVRVVEKVERRFAFGRMEAFVLEPDIKDLGGVFKKSPDGELRFFISADERKLPLRMESEVAVGKFWAELVEIGEPSGTGSVAVTEVD
ncbi:MAG: DUF3108 domain-containing protein [Oceanipulchritudo sp.]